MKKSMLLMLSIALSLSLSACGTKTVQEQENEKTDTVEEQVGDFSSISEEEITISETYSSKEDGAHVLEADGGTLSYSNIRVEKSGDSSGDEADFYGENAAIFASSGATLELNEIIVKSDGTHANGVFSYGEGTTVNISDSLIETSGNCSGGLMTTGGGTMNASNLNIHTTGNSSAAIRSDRGGGTVRVSGGYYLTEGKGSPAIYSTADITVNDAILESTSSQGIVVEGQNSVTLNNVELIANNVSKNSDKSDWYQAVMIYQSMSGDADEGLASFSMEGGSLTNRNGDLFFVNNTTAEISLKGVSLSNEDEEGLFLRAAAAGWGSEGSNGGHVTMKLEEQTLEGNILVDEVSSLNLYLKENSSYTGAINTDRKEGEVYVEIEEGSSWVLSGDSYITSLTCSADCIDLNGHKLYVNGEEYVPSTASEGEAIKVEISHSSGHENRPERPEGGNHRPEDRKEPPEKPDGEKEDQKNNG